MNTQHSSLNDTIASIATPIGESGLGIIRISGSQSIPFTDRIFTAKSGRKLSRARGYSVQYGWVVDKAKAGGTDAIIDEVLVTLMRAPRSFTKEDVVEISCHGGIIVLRSILEKLLSLGCRLAEPGEFTKRAFLNGRIDLTQAEAVLDIIRAKTDAALRLGIHQLQGGLSSQIEPLRKSLLVLLSFLEADIDFPEDRDGPENLAGRLKALDPVKKSLREIIRQGEVGRAYREGIQTVICGRPNVGKSSLLNALLKRERSIVTHIAGTTRDTIEEIIDIKGIPVRIVDTAGIIEPADLIEKKAIERTRHYIKTADLVLMVFDGASRLTSKDKALLKKIVQKKRPLIAVINKIDKKQKIEKSYVQRYCGRCVELSAKKAVSIELLEQAILDFVCQGSISGPESLVVANARHMQALKKAYGAVEQAVSSAHKKLSSEFIAQQLKDALAVLDGLLGKSFSEDLLDRIFSDFCIGK